VIYLLYAPATDVLYSLQQGLGNTWQMIDAEMQRLRPAEAGELLMLAIAAHLHSTVMVTAYCDGASYRKTEDFVAKPSLSSCWAVLNTSDHCFAY
jgi:hypothetical protein